MSLPTLAGLITVTGTALSTLAARVTDSREYTIPFLVALALVVAVSFSPRIPLDLGLLGQRRFDIRIEDLLLVVAVMSLVVCQWGPEHSIGLPRYFIYLLAYLAVGAVTTAVGIAMTDLPAFRGLFYYLKEVEYGFVALVVANAVRSRKQVYVFTIVLVVCALANAGWAGVQILTDSTGPLFVTVERSAYYGTNVGAPGTTLISEPSRLSSGGYYIAPLFLMIAWLMMARRRSHLFWLIATTAAFVALIASLSRSSVLSVIVTLFALGLLLEQIPNRWMFTFLVASLPIGVALATVIPISRFHPSDIVRGVFTRFEKWQPVIDSFSPTILFGYGKGSLPYVAGVEEAHNFYLRILVETGVIGLIMFIAVLVHVIITGVHIYNRSVDPVLRTVGIAGVCATVSLAIVAVVQDAFINVKLAESYWLVVGAVGSALWLIE
jgi:hypothetical protein